MRFRDRREAGELLAAALADRTLLDPLVLGLPRGGVPVAFEVAMALDAPLDVLVVRKVGAPGHEEYGIGAVGEGDVIVADEAVLRMLHIDRRGFTALAAAEREELDRRRTRYRGDRALPSLTGRDVVLVDDGLATGVTAEAAIAAARCLEPRRVLLCAPACAADTAARLAALADEVVCVTSPDDFVAVGLWYETFDQTTDDEVLSLLDEARARRGGRGGRG